ncbi:oxidoreductase [Planotetraspora thailandica]|uniref:Oxidoreductase n=1 Tax=Planotetraspora thailandica TaxID=487172 RepID=A0A8J3XYP9_9ACTN|nr:SDR family NAD(P)-dependent oxidoreductase [Planotetraspora thailandica]GII57710.1 oxidoreductase [Planotetraspora thailandica]
MSTLQEPITDTPFDASSTADDVIKGIDLTGKVAIVTGGHSGIGAETTRVLRAAGAQVIVPVRQPEKAAHMLKGVDGVDIEKLDLIDPASVDAFAERFLASGRPLHILVNSAGIMGVPLSRDARGYESHFATNHLGHHQLTVRLWRALLDAHGARVVAVSAAAHRYSPVVFDDPHFERRDYHPMLGYGQSKTANILFARELDRRGAAHGVRAFSVHPGSILGTNLSRYAPTEALRAMGLLDEHGNPVIDPFAGKKNVQQGASTSVWCAVSPQLDDKGGVYCLDNNIAVVVDPDSRTTDPLRHGTSEIPPAGLSPHAASAEDAARLWDLSDELTGATLP